MAGSMAAVRIAAPVQNRVRPAFTVRKLEGKRTVEIFSFDAKGKRKSTMTEVDAGYLVRMAAGHSIRVANDAELHRLGLDDTIPLVNVDNGEVMGSIASPTAADGTLLDDGVLPVEENDE